MFSFDQVLSSVIPPETHQSDMTYLVDSTYQGPYTFKATTMFNFDQGSSRVMLPQTCKNNINYLMDPTYQGHYTSEATNTFNFDHDNVPDFDDITLDWDDMDEILQRI